jgi:hypothetical protein
MASPKQNDIKKQPSVDLILDDTDSITSPSKGQTTGPGSTINFENSMTTETRTRGSGKPKSIEERYGTGEDGKMRKWLHQRGFDPEMVQGAKETWPNNTPMHEAAKRGHTKVLVWLHKHGAGKDVMAKNWHGYTPLHFAAEKGSVESFQFLMKSVCFCFIIRSIRFIQFHLISTVFSKVITFLISAFI